MRLIWRVDPKPTGRYRSFDCRRWPSAFYHGTDTPAGHIFCPEGEEYAPWRVKTGQHPPLKLRIIDHSRKGPMGGWKFVVSKADYKTLEEAKEALARILEARPTLRPQDY